MKAMAKRLADLERGTGELSPAVRAWLGWAPADAAPLRPIGTKDTNGTDALTAEDKVWLGIA